MARKLDNPAGSGAPDAGASEEKRRRLAAALRENLGRRKAQDRERRALTDAGAVGSEADPSGRAAQTSEDGGAPKKRAE